MLKIANTSVEHALRLFNGAGVTVGLLVPTETGYKKSIMDATLSMRSFLHETNIHDYATQPQGPDAKVLVPANFVLPDKFVKTTASLYRPITKKGDPRIWFSKLTRYCAPTDLLAIIALRGELFVFNMSDTNVVQAFGIPGSCPYEVLTTCSEIISPIARELLDKLHKIHNEGFIQGISHGDTNVGMTLENLLGIEPNSSQAPDYKGIELKTSRKLGQAVQKISKTKKVTLFAKTPDWERSKFNARQILEKFGYISKNKLRLSCTVSEKPNRQGLYLDAQNEVDLFNRAKTESYTGDVAVWSLEDLKEQFSLKHNETFWIQASSQILDGKEFFQYDLVRHTRKPNVSNLATLIDAGIVTLDYTLSLQSNGKLRNHGYLFRTTSDKFAHIFPLERVYELG